MEYVGHIKCYNTLSGRYEDVPVTIEIEEFIRRSYWREDMQDRRYYSRALELLDIAYSSSYIVSKQDISVSVVEQEEVFNLLGAVRQLNSRDRYIVERIYFEDAKMKEVAEEMGVSLSYVSRLVKKIMGQLRIVLDSM